MANNLSDKTLQDLGLVRAANTNDEKYFYVIPNLPKAVFYVLEALQGYMGDRVFYTYTCPAYKETIFITRYVRGYEAEIGIVLTTQKEFNQGVKND